MTASEHLGRRALLTRLGLFSWLAGALLCTSCESRPVPHLERAMDTLAADHEEARQIHDPVAQARAYIDLRERAVAFRAELDGETEIRPKAQVRASSSYEAGMGWVSVDRRDVASVRGRADRLIRSLDRFLETAAPVRLEGTGYRVADGHLVEETTTP
jgi:hypothetical protein